MKWTEAQHKSPMMNGFHSRNGVAQQSKNRKPDLFERAFPHSLFYDPDPDNLQDYPDPAPFDINAPAFYDPDPNNLEDYPEPAPLATTEIHLDVMTRLLQLLKDWLSQEEMAYVAADLMVYHNKRKACAPDVMVCFGVEKKKRRSYKIVEEKQPPTVIFEILSNTTALADQTIKFDLYEELKVQEYFLFDPEQNLMDDEGLKGYRLNSQGVYEKIVKRKGRLKSLSLGLEVGRQGEHVGLYNTKTKSWLPDRLEILAIQEKEGIQEGFAQGAINGRQDSIIDLASEKFGQATKNELKTLKNIKDLDHLRRINLQIGKASSWSDLLKTP